MVIPECKDNRHQIVTSAEATSIKEWALLLDAEFGPKNYSIPTWVAPNFMTRFVAIFDGTVRLVRVACQLACDDIF